jgi:hypothetical protein
VYTGRIHSAVVRRKRYSVSINLVNFADSGFQDFILSLLIFCPIALSIIS